MKFKEVLVDSSAQLIQLVANEIDDNEKLFNELLIFCFEEKKQLSNRASRVVEKISLTQPQLLLKNIDQIIEKLPYLKDNSVVRNFLQAIFNNIKFIEDENQLGKIVNFCFLNINNAYLPIALRYYSIKIINDLTLKYPELIPEFTEILQLLLNDESVGIKGYSRKLLKYYVRKKA